AHPKASRAVLPDDKENKMSTETVLTGDKISDLGEQLMYADGWSLSFARAIEKAVLQSPEIQELRKDARRLDFIESEGAADVYQSEDADWIVDTGGQFGIGGDLREAIDAAMEKQP